MIRESRHALLISLALLIAFSAPVTRGQDEVEAVEAQEPTEALEAPDAAEPEVVDRYGDMVSIFSRALEVPEGVRQIGSVICVGCAGVTIRGDVMSDVVVVMSQAEITGRVGGAVPGVLSDIELKDTEVRGEVVSVLGSLRIENTRVEGELVTVLSGYEEHGEVEVRGESVRVGDFGAWLPSIWWMIFWLRLLHKVCVFALILLLVALVPDRIRIIGEEAPVRFVPAFFVGILGYLAWLVVIGLLGATVVGIPLAVLAFYAMKWMGIAGIFCAIGRRLGRSLGREMSVLGAVLLTFGIYSVLWILPTPLGVFGLVISLVVGVLFFLLVEVPAVGLVILTRFGSPPRQTMPEQVIVPAPAMGAPARPEPPPQEPPASDRPT